MFRKASTNMVSISDCGTIMGCTTKNGFPGQGTIILMLPMRLPHDFSVFL